MRCRKNQNLLQRVFGTTGTVCLMLEWSIQNGDELRIDCEFDRSGLAGSATDEASLVQAFQHGVHRGWREVEKPLKLCRNNDRGVCRNL